MADQLGPHNNGTCGFHLVPDDVSSADPSINRCIRCVVNGNHHLKTLTEDFHQLAYLTILEEMPKYDPGHPSGASFITFIKSRVCSRLHSMRREELRYLPFAHDEEPTEDDARPPNPLVASLNAEAHAAEGVDDTVVERVTKTQLIEILREMLAQLPPQEHQVLMLKYFYDFSGVIVAQKMNVSEGRVSQITSSALARLKKWILRELEEQQAERQVAASHSR